ncbi:iron-containing alcohol dehydrogenase [Variovorax sp. WS11]|uniref:iron-containing alcohol dehydrogenase n=1 Tax=Variovorax sp. WS11 TaxID=1105204 RepID=UPI0011B2693E|nr:iron-containing alcohol dehydrogenase [Variovorax sp. WS11]NDZ17359.1 iron-containing alcohol dehydrogenase [Variovorax sp. WS11]
MNPNTNAQDKRQFTARALPVHLYSGDGALSRLPSELSRFGAHRAVIICGRSVHSKTGLIRHMEQMLGARFAGVFAELAEGAPSECIERAAAFARELACDALIAVGAGSVLKGTRVVAMLMGEGRPLPEMATRYGPDGKPASTRLLQPKVPIFNVLTAPTTAQNRGGSALRMSGSLHQLEFFDPKTRPKAIFWDPVALATAPASLISSAGLEVFFFALMGLGSAPQSNVLVAPSRVQAWNLASTAMMQLDDLNSRLDLCAAAYLQNRDEDDGGQPLKTHLAARAAYALSVALFNRCEGLTQSHGYAAFSGASVRKLGRLCNAAMSEIGTHLGVASVQHDNEYLDLVASAIDDAFVRLGWPVKLPARSVMAAGVDELVGFAIRNYNANSDGALTPHANLLKEVLLESLAAS